MELMLPHECLAVFVDDTGHEDFDGQPVYGLGGCGVMATNLDRVIQEPWREVRKKITGSQDTPLHAATFARTASKEQMEIIGEFFRRHPFFRLGAVVSTKTTFVSEAAPMSSIAGVLKSRIVDIARWTAFKELKVIFEASERADKRIEDAFQDFRIEENGQPLPVECYFMPKCAAEPALEVADFVMHAVQTQVRRKLKGLEGFSRDFQAVFHSVDRKLISFMEVNRVEK